MLPITDSLESDRLLLEVRKEHHADLTFDLFCEPDLYRYIKWNIPPSLEWLKGGMKRLESLVSDDGKEIGLGWIAIDKTSQKPIGLFEMDIVGDDTYVAYTIFKPYWGQGFAVEGVKAIMPFIEKHYKPSRFIIEMDTRNRGSIKVAKKLGFDFVQVKNNVQFLQGLVSHEFQFQKVLI